MKIAVTYEKGQVFQHFGHTKEFKVYDCRDGRVESARVENAGVMTVLEPAAVAALLAAVTASLVDGSFNPFLYFRF